MQKKDVFVFVKHFTSFFFDFFVLNLWTKGSILLVKSLGHTRTLAKIHSIKF